MTHLAKLFLVLGILFLYPGIAAASGTGDHHHDTEETVVEEVVPEEVLEEVHDNSDGHHDAPVEPTVIEVMEEEVPDHHEDAAPDHHDDMAASEEHDHASHEEGTWASNGFERLFAWLGKFHPAATNFPIGLLLAAFLAEAMFMGTGNASLRAAVRFCLWTGAISAGATALLGWGFVGFDYASDDSVLSVHRWNGTAVGVTALIALWLGERTFAHRSPAWIFRAALFLTAAMVAVNGYLGGKMVYGAGHYAWPIS